MGPYPNLLAYGGYVAVGGGVASLVGSLGGVLNVVRDDVGEYTVNFKSPGVPGYAQHNTSGVPIVVPVNNAAAIVTCTLASPTALTVFAFDAAGVAADCSFAFVVYSTERQGGVT